MTILFAPLLNNLKNDLTTYCFEHISRDIQHTDDFAVNVEAQYRSKFVPYATQGLIEIQPELNNMNAIQYAAYRGYDRFIEANHALISDALNIPNAEGMTPLHLAALNGHVHTVTVLLDLGADPKQVNKQQQLPIYNALMLPFLYDKALKSNKEKIFNLLSVCNPETLAHKDKLGDTVFHALASNGYTQCLNALLHQDTTGAFYSNNYSLYPIHVAILNHRPDIVALLLRIDKVATLTDSNERVALHYAAMYGSAEVVRLCYLATHDINIQDNDGKTPLALALNEHNQGAVDVLTEYGLVAKS